MALNECGRSVAAGCAGRNLVAAIPFKHNRHIAVNGGLKMDKNRVSGAVDQAKGAVKEAAGKVTGDQKLQTEGKADKAAGKVESAVGGAKDAARDALNKP
jgi:uncharacterized protein YjbJ (UPF0337 family)